ncbi:hypothetical protein Q7P37_005577 [Cladosporium fusiforme]
MPFIKTRLTSEAAVETTPPAFASLIQDLSASELSKTARRFTRSTAVPFRGTSRSQKYRKEAAVGECPKGQNYYICQSTGFKGCCSKNACDPDVKCPESGDVEPRSSSRNSTSTHPELTTSLDNTQVMQSMSENSHDTTTTSETRPVKSAVTSAAGKPLEPQSHHTAIRATEDVALAPPCPRGNGTTFTDNSKIAYIVRCNSDNTAPAFTSMQVSIGGYAQCFSSCSNSSDCAGFTYNGEDSGVCYLKSRMPRDSYVAKSMANYISCAKVDPSASAPRPTPSAPAADTSSKQPNKGAIAGGVVGGIAIIALVLFLIAFLARRRRKEHESKRATLTHVSGGAVEPGRRDDDHDAPTLPLHHRSGSTSHDVFAPYGGAYYPQYSTIAPTQPQMQQSAPQPYQQHARQRYSRTGVGGSISKDYALQPMGASAADNKHGTSISTKGPYYPTTSPYPLSPPIATHPPVQTPRNDDQNIYFLPATTYRPQAHNTPEPIAQLDGTPVSTPGSRSRSPRFHEHISELEDTSSPQAAISSSSGNTNAKAQRRWGSVLYANKDSPTPGLPDPQPDGSLGREAMMNDARRRQEALHEATMGGHGPDGRAAGGSGIGKSRPGERRAGGETARKEGEVSPDMSGSPLDRSFIVSPMGSLERRGRI